MRRRQFRENILEWADENLRDFPWWEPDWSFYKVFVAEFFLTQTPADNVAKLYPRFIRRFPNLDALEFASLSEIADSIKPIGFHNMRAAALNAIADEYDELPREREELQQLPRVGSYVANATVCFADNERVPILDRNVRRVYERVFGDEFVNTVSEEEFAESLLPESPHEAKMYNMALLDFGATLCQKGEPNCEACFARRYCTYYCDEVNTRDFNES